MKPFAGLFTKSEREWLRQMTELDIATAQSANDSENGAVRRWRKYNQELEMQKENDPPQFVRYCATCGEALIQISQRSLRDAEILTGLLLSFEADEQGSREAHMRRVRKFGENGRKFALNRIAKLKTPEPKCCQYCAHHEGRGHTWYCVTRKKVIERANEALATFRRKYKAS
jgi:hypothetical protein